MIGVDDQQYGQRLAAFVVLKPGISATPETLKQHPRQPGQLQVPRDIAVLDEPLRGITGKILRTELQSRVGSQIFADGTPETVNTCSGGIAQCR